MTRWRFQYPRERRSSGEANGKGGSRQTSVGRHHSALSLSPLSHGCKVGERDTLHKITALGSNTFTFKESVWLSMAASACRFGCVFGTTHEHLCCEAGDSFEQLSERFRFLEFLSFHLLTLPCIWLEFLLIASGKG